MPHDFFTLIAERLVVIGFRNVMAAHDLGDATFWEQAWQEYIRTLGSGPARRLMGELQFWTRAIRTHSCKTMRYFPCSCCHICHDECMAVAAIAAAQRSDRHCTELAAQNLLGTRAPDALKEFWLASCHFGAALKIEKLELFPVTPDVIASIVALEEYNTAGRKPNSLH